MKGWQIFIHSVRQVFGNLNAALKVSALLYLVQFLAQPILLGDAMRMNDAQRQAMMMSGEFPFMGTLLFSLIAVITGLWIAVGWHRYVLTEEQPGILPPFHFDRMLGYLGKGILIGLIMVIPVFVIGAVVGMLGGGMMQRGNAGGVMLLTLVIALPIVVIGMRLSTMLPGAALQSGVPVMSGWEATKGDTMTFVALAAISILLLGLPQMLGALLFHSSATLSFVWEFVINWPILMIGISVLTTLYGHYIQKRPLV